MVVITYVAFNNCPVLPAEMRDVFTSAFGLVALTAAWVCVTSVE